MPSLLKLNQDLTIAKDLTLITESLGEVSAVQYKTTHDRINHNAYFFREIGRVYRDLKLAAERQRFLSKKKIEAPKNGKTVCILMTSNYQFYGDLDKQLGNYFASNTANFKADLLVLGAVGKDYLETIGFNRPYQAFVFKTDVPTRQEITQILTIIKPYSRILVYHPKFATLLDQEVAVTELTTETIEEEKDTNIDFIVEPELSKMLEFFENQILASRLDSIFLQAQLSRTTARMVGMDEAEINAEKETDKRKLEVNQEKKRLQNLRILETFITVSEVKR